MEAIAAGLEAVAGRDSAAELEALAGVMAGLEAALPVVTGSCRAGSSGCRRGSTTLRCCRS